MALLDRRQEMHESARQAWSALLTDEFQPITSNYVLLETCSLIQRRTGVDAVLAFTLELVPALKTVWVDADIHDAGLVAVLGASQRNLALVDCTSFELMRREGIRYAFSFDKHFVDRNLVLPPFPEP
ncbi:MAG: PIN domain-containing protein [Armatimonadota bacterium]